MDNPSQPKSPGMIRTPNSLRAIQIVVGAVTLVLAAIVIVAPGFALLLVAVWLSLSLLFGGIEGIIIGAGARHMSRGWRAIRIAVGAIAIGLSIAILAFPGAALITSLFILSAALLVLGAGGIASGISNRHIPKWARAMMVVVGAVTIGLSIPVWIFPAFGTSVLLTFVAVALIVNGASYIVAGGTGVMFRPIGPGAGEARRRSWESDAA